MISAIVQLITGLLNFLPVSPFTSMLAGLEVPYLGYLNWVIPFDVFLKLISAWLPCMAAYYIYQTIRSKLK